MYAGTAVVTVINSACMYKSCQHELQQQHVSQIQNGNIIPIVTLFVLDFILVTTEKQVRVKVVQQNMVGTMTNTRSTSERQDS